jgi:hypothetical protein
MCHKKLFFGIRQTDKKEVHSLKSNLKNCHSCIGLDNAKYCCTRENMSEYILKYCQYEEKGVLVDLVDVELKMGQTFSLFIQLQIKDAVMIHAVLMQHFR